MGNDLTFMRKFEVWDSDRPVLEMLAETRKVKSSFLHDDGRTLMVVAGTEKKLRRFEKDLETNKLLRSKGAIETVIDSLTIFTKRLGNAVGSMREDWDSVHITRDGNELVIRIGYFEDEGAKPNESDIPDNNGVFGEVPCAEEDGVLLDTQGFDKGEDGYLPDDDTGRPGNSGAGTGKTVVDVPLDEGEWLTVKEYSERYGVPKATVRNWVKRGLLRIRKDLYPVRVLDGKKAPIRDDKGQRKIWNLVDRDISMDANSLVD